MMSDYDAQLMNEQLRMMNGAIDSFLNSYGTHRGSDNQRTVILLPGGMGSELARATQPFSGALGGSYEYETLWVDLKKIFLDQGALLMQMDGNVDDRKQFVVANGPLRNCALHPYDGFTNWCNVNGLDLLMVGWDFRRDADWNVNFLLDLLFPEVTRRAQDRGWPDPMQGATIVGHSFGGMLVKWILNKHQHPFCRQLRLAITVGTPFYGNPGQTERFFVSEPALGPLYNLDEITKVIATLPGGFSLFFLDSDTYDANRGQLEGDPEFPLDRYPSFDSDNRAIRVDPYMKDPDNLTSPNLCRYPIRGPQPGDNWTWFQSYVDKGRSEYRAVAQALDPTMSAKLHNIRGVQLNGAAPALETKVMQQWGWYDTSQPRMPQAKTVLKTFGGPGDGVIPAWSARLATQPQAHVHTVRGPASGDPHLEHMTLMDWADVRSIILGLMRPGAAEVLVGARGPAPAAREEFAKLQQDIGAVAAAATDAEADAAKAAVGNRLDALGVGQSRALALRWLMELHKGLPHSGPPPAYGE
ncbi:MAG: hypothetical protein JO339_11925 [Alphaproteobacteria bacterium]|nr:hypothetical protein [Alphaproteobacteria bacterium]